MTDAVRLQGLQASAFILLAGAIGLLAGKDPTLAIAGALAIVFVLVTLANLYVGVVLFILATSVAAAPGVIGSGVTVTKLLGVLLVVSWLGSLAMRREARSDFLSAHPATTLVLALLVSWVATSQLWADAPGDSRDALLRLSLNAVLFLVVFTAVRTPAQAMGVIAAFVAGAGLDAALGLVDPADVNNSARLSGTTTEPGELAASLVAGLVLSLGLAAVLRRRPLGRLAVQGAAALCAAGVFFTGSRAGLIALAVALAAFIAIGSRWRGRILVLTALIAITGVGFFNYAASSDLRDRVYTVGSGSGRIDLWTVGWRMVEDRPVQGVGIGNYQAAAPRYALEPGVATSGEYVFERPKAVHNTYLELWAETGLVGLALFLFIVGFCLRSALRAAREFAAQRDFAMELLSRAVFVAMAGFLAGAFFTSRLYEKDVWLVLALGPTLLGVAQAQLTTSRTERDGGLFGSVLSPQPLRQLRPGRPRG